MGAQKAQFTVRAQVELEVVAVVPVAPARDGGLDRRVLDLANALELLTQDLDLGFQLGRIWQVLVVTAADSSVLSSLADLVVLIPAGVSQQYGGSVFEQSALVALDAVVMMLRQRLGVTDEAMDLRHANLE